MKHVNEHKYAKITRDCNGYYEVAITLSYDTAFGHKEDIEKLPFRFRSAEIAKDFVSILPDNIEKTDIKKGCCRNCPICYVKYKTYKLTLGKYNVYVKWEDIEPTRFDFMNGQIIWHTRNNIVKSFVSQVTITKFQKLNYSNDTHNIVFGTECEKLSDLIEKIKDKNDIDPEEYTFELIEQ